MARAQLTESDLRAQLRRHGVWRLGDVRLAVLETTGDFSVLPAGSGEPSAWALADVMGRGEGSAP